MIFSYKNTAHVKKEILVKTADSLAEYIVQVNEIAKHDNYSFHESFINLPLDEQVVQHLTALKKKLVAAKLKYIVVVGIGGSNLGTKAIYDALFGSYDLIEPKRTPKVLFADTSDTASISKLAKFLSEIASPEEVIVNAISKSGSTTETIANLEIILSNAPALKNRLVITTCYGSPLWNISQKQNIELLPMPDKIGGRYSVFTVVGLFPLLCAGVNIFELLEGALELREKCLNSTVLENPAVVSATASFLAYKEGRSIHDLFIFHPELESLGKWYRQLMGESLGKDGVGMTPTVSIGSTDLHSMYQLYIGGVKDKFFTFISAAGHSDPLSVDSMAFPLDGTSLSGKNTNQIMSALFESVKETYAENNLPYVEIQLQSISEKSLGKFMQMKMMEIMYLAKLLNVNAFDQPDVEGYKIHLKRYLGQLS